MEIRHILLLEGVEIDLRHSTLDCVVKFFNYCSKSGDG